MEDNISEQLFRKYFDNTLSKEELKVFVEIIDDLSQDDFSKLLDKTQPAEQLKITNLSSLKRQVLYKQIHSRIGHSDFLPQTKSRKKIKKIYILWSLGIAASLIFLLFKYHNYKAAPINYQELSNAEDVSLPINHQIILTSTSGKKEEVRNDKSRSYNDLGLKVIVDANKEVTYVKKSSGKSDLGQITFSNPKGVISKLLLEDGSIAYLNSNSSITYPDRFAHNCRDVEITGEIFFDVFHDANRPFQVKTRNHTIKVLGTQFNVNCYSEDHLVTSLLSGKVEVKTPNERRVLKPGDQAVCDLLKGHIDISKFRDFEVLAWKEGKFNFNKSDIKQVLSKINDWYEIDGFDIRFQSNDKFSGSIKRTKKLSELLSQLEKISSYKFKIENRRIIVMK